MPSPTIATFSFPVRLIRSALAFASTFSSRYSFDGIGLVSSPRRGVELVATDGRTLFAASLEHAPESAPFSIAISRTDISRALKTEGRSTPKARAIMFSVSRVSKPGAPIDLVVEMQPVDKIGNPVGSPVRVEVSTSFPDAVRVLESCRTKDATSARVPLRSLSSAVAMVRGLDRPNASDYLFAISFSIKSGDRSEVSFGAQLRKMPDAVPVPGLGAVVVEVDNSSEAPPVSAFVDVALDPLYVDAVATSCRSNGKPGGPHESETGITISAQGREKPVVFSFWSPSDVPGQSSNVSVVVLPIVT